MNPLKTIKGTIGAGVVLAIVLALIVALAGNGVRFNVPSFLIWLHVLAGITWIGLLYYFNFVQVPALAQAASDQGGPGGAGITKYVAPRALLWFRWGAVFTWLTGASYLGHTGLLLDAFTLGMRSNGSLQGTFIGVGAWLGTIMLFNVWVFIWPNQKKVLGLVEATAEQIAQARKTAFTASRLNTVLSIPMLMSMVSLGHAGFFL
ncbi:MAG TPA: urate hydroxylase PuuD [Gammaproteobacteria bacterium]|nr:urate hydroxylase PuuD [Gammaproteobacteria bacterium]